MTDIANEYAADPQMRAVSLGLDVQHFITHDKVGRYLIERAHQCRIEALESLAEVDVYEPLAVQKLQNQAKIPELFLQWLDEAIANGTAEEENIALAEQFER